MLNTAAQSCSCGAGIVLFKTGGAASAQSGHSQGLSRSTPMPTRARFRGGGSSQVYPGGLNAVPGLQPRAGPGRSSIPVVATEGDPGRRPAHRVTFVDGSDPAAAGAGGRRSVEVELASSTNGPASSIDASITLPDDLYALVAAVVSANSQHARRRRRAAAPPHAVGRSRLRGIVEAWYPGSGGGEAHRQQRSSRWVNLLGICPPPSRRTKASCRGGPARHRPRQIRPFVLDRL